MEIREILNTEQKATICNDILRALPDWFGIEASLVEYVNGVGALPFYAAFDNDAPVGFAALKEHGAHTAEICVMGVLTRYHRHGLGRRLVDCCEQFCRETGRTFLTVKTLAETHPDEGYQKTRLFYLGMGFKPLEVFPLLWDEKNPCLFLAKYVRGIGGGRVIEA